MRSRSKRKAETAKVEPNPQPAGKLRSGPKSSVSEVGGTSGGPWTHPSDNRIMKMRFELELLICRDAEADADTTGIEYCSTTLVSGFNEKEPRPLYEMYASLEYHSAADDPTKWKLYVYDDEPDTEYCRSLSFKIFRRITLMKIPVAALLLSPLFNVSSRISRPPWRDSVKEVSAYFQTNSVLEVDDFPSTSIWISIEPRFSLTEVKRIAQCGIHFEPAIEALMLQSVGADQSFTMGNWALSWDFAPSMRTRPEAIELVENSPTLAAVSALMQRNQPLKNYTWEFKHLGQPQERIEYYRCPPFDDAQKAIRYLEFTMCFVRVAIRCPRERLLTVPSNVGGVRWFMTRFREAWLYNCALMPSIWRGIPSEARSEPRSPEWTEEQWGYIEDNNLYDVREMIREDVIRSQAFASNARAPYF